MSRKYFLSSFYTDPYIIKLTRDQMYFYQYLLLCQRNNLSGIYECPVEVMSFESKFSVEEVKSFIDKLQNDKKLSYTDDYVILKNFLKNQSYNRNIMIAVLNQFLDLPLNILEIVFSTESILNVLKLKTKKCNQFTMKYWKGWKNQESLGNH